MIVPNMCGASIHVLSDIELGNSVDSFHLNSRF